MISKNKLDTDILIVGAGAIGLSISYAFLKKGINVILIDKEKNFGSINSSRNTETIHAGIYYKENSLKHLLCLKGKKLLYEFCEKYKIKYKKCGKIFIATEDKEIDELEKIKIQGNKNGLRDLVELNKNQVFKIEPLLNVRAGLLSPSSGVFDTYNFIQTLMNICVDKGLTYSNNSEIRKIKFFDNYCSIDTFNNRSKESFNITSKSIINSAGLGAIELSNKLFPEFKTPVLNPIKGAYLKYSGKSPFKHIIYPTFLPGKIKERVDATPNVYDELRFGPSVEKCNDKNDFSINNKLILKLYANIKKYFNKVEKKKLFLDQAGIRPKIIEKDVELSDFKFVWGPDKKLLNLWGIESPGLTASLAIGDYVFDKFKEKDIL